MRACVPLGLLVWAIAASGGPSEMLCLTPGVDPPAVLRRVEPEYTRDARQAQIQGSATFELTVNEKGHPHAIRLLSPIGFGLDERARESLEQWRFRPAHANERNIPAVVLVEVRFRLPSAYYDAAAEQRRTAFNVAVAQAKGRDLALVDPAIAKLRELAANRFAPAMHFVAKLDELLGRAAPAQVFRLIQAAADANYGPALYEMGQYYLRGTLVRPDSARGLRLIHDAALLGSAAAQNDLGVRYENGGGVPRDTERARRYFRLCAAKGNALCQYRLARLLLSNQDCPERDRMQAIAWCQLASGNLPEARQTADDELARMSPRQIEWISRIRPQLANDP
jgi:TonB family protein